MDKSLADQTKLTNANLPVKITIFIGHNEYFSASDTLNFNMIGLELFLS